MHLCGQFLHMCDAASTYVGRMCPGACAQDTFLMQCCRRWEDKKEDKAFKDISDTQNVQCIVLFVFSHPPTQVLSVFMHLCGQFLHMCDAASTYVGRMCPGACAQDIFLMQWYNRWEDKTEDKAFKDISDTQNVQCIVFFSHPPKCCQCSCTYVGSFFTCDLLRLHMWAGCVQAHAPKILSGCSATIGKKIRRKARHSRT